METIQINGKSYLIDIEKATEQGLLKKKDNKPRSWEEYAEATSGIIGYKASLHYSGAYGNQYDIFKNVDEARAFNALGKLIQLRDTWVGEWRPNWETCTNKYAIVVLKENIAVETGAFLNKILAFPTEKMATDFLNTFRDLIEQAKMFL